ncbi:MAG: fumarate hydratase, partial [Psychrobacillus psychrodurans]
MQLEQLEKSIYDLITETSTNLPKDVRRAIKKAKAAENAGTRAAMSLDTITNNIQMADDNVSPICQDTGLPTFKIKTPIGVNQIEIKAAIKRAIATATKDAKLRPNAVDSLTG